jgi:dolichyl-phosphate-mannose-protein mannosyltransferase
MLALERHYRTAALSVFVFGVVLRVTLACLNWEANDDHLAVSRVIADEHRIPDKDELEEAFQPKLYHLIVAALWTGVPTQTPAIRIRLAQGVSCLAGLFVLRVVWRCVMSAASLAAKARFLAFALVALNPSLIGINAQATNDSLVILFVSLSLYYGYRFFEGRRVTDFAWMTIATMLAGLSKGNGIVLFIAIILVFMLAGWHGWSGDALTRGQALLYGSIFVAVYLILVPRLGPYGDYYAGMGHRL